MVSSGAILPLGSGVVQFDSAAGGALELNPGHLYQVNAFGLGDVTTRPPDPVLFQFGNPPPYQDPMPPTPAIPPPLPPVDARLEVNVTPTGNPNEYLLEPVYHLSGDARLRGTSVSIQAENEVFSSISGEGASLTAPSTRLDTGWTKIPDSDGVNRKRANPSLICFGTRDPANPATRTDLSGVREVAMGSAVVTFPNSNGALRLENFDVSVHSGEPDVGTTLGGGLEASERFFEFGDVPEAQPAVLLLICTVAIWLRRRAG